MATAELSPWMALATESFSQLKKPPAVLLFVFLMFGIYGLKLSKGTRWLEQRAVKEGGKPGKSTVELGCRNREVVVCIRWRREGIGRSPICVYELAGIALPRRVSGWTTYLRVIVFFGILLCTLEQG